MCPGSPPSQMCKRIHRVVDRFRICLCVSVFVSFRYFLFVHFVLFFSCSKCISNFSLPLSKCFLPALHQLDSPDESRGCRKPSSWCSPSGSIRSTTSRVISNSDQFSKFKIKSFEVVWSCCAVIWVVWRLAVIKRDHTSLVPNGVSNRSESLDQHRTGGCKLEKTTTARRQRRAQFSGG